MTSFLTAARSEQEQMTPDSRRLRLFSGTSNPALAKEISAYLGVPDGPRVCKRLPTVSSMCRSRSRSVAATCS